MLGLRKHLVRGSGFRLWLERSAFAAALACLGAVTIAVPVDAQKPTTAPEEQTYRLSFFAWCTGKPRPAPESDLMALDHDCAVLVDGVARVFYRTAELLNQQRVRETQEQDPNHARKDRQIKADFNQVGGAMVLAGPLILCEIFNDRRLARHTDTGSCLIYDGRMDGSALDLVALIEQNPDKLPHFKGIAPRQGGPEPDDALPEIARARFLHQFPIGSSTDAAIAWLQSLGFACEIDQCRFGDGKWEYDPGNAGFASYDWIVTLRRSARGSIANLEVDLAEGPYP